VHRTTVGCGVGYPRFKPAHRFDSVEWPKDGDGCRWHADTRKVYLQGIGQVKVTVHRQVDGRVKTIQVRRQGRRWMLILSCDGVPNGAAAKTGLHRSIHDARWALYEEGPDGKGGLVGLWR
jgi:putative transposase